MFTGNSIHSNPKELKRVLNTFLPHIKPQLFQRQWIWARFSSPYSCWEELYGYLSMTSQTHLLWVKQAIPGSQLGKNILSISSGQVIMTDSPELDEVKPTCLTAALSHAEISQFPDQLAGGEVAVPWRCGASGSGGSPPCCSCSDMPSVTHPYSNLYNSLPSVGPGLHQ